MGKERLKTHWLQALQWFYGTLLLVSVCIFLYLLVFGTIYVWNGMMYGYIYQKVACLRHFRRVFLACEGLQKKLKVQYGGKWCAEMRWRGEVCEVRTDIFSFFSGYFCSNLLATICLILTRTLYILGFISKSHYLLRELFKLIEHKIPAYHQV